MTACRRIRPSLGGYVLDGLEPAERAELDAHLATCTACRRELEDLAPLPALLGLAGAAPRRSPADLRQRVLRRASPRRHRHRLVAAALASAAAVVMTVVVGAAVWFEGPLPADEVVTFATDAPTRLSGEAALTQVATGVRIDLEVVGVRPSAEGYYQAWLQRGDTRISAGTFIGPSDGRASVQLLCGGRLEHYDRLTITWHPRGDGAEVVAVDTPVGSGREPGGADPDPWG